MAVTASFKAVFEGTWIGWKIQSNWTDPLLFSIYFLLRPISGLLITGFIYVVSAAAGGRVTPAQFSYLFVGTAFFVYVIQVTLVMSWLIHEERARYEVLKPLYIASSSLRPYLFGRGLAATIDATVSVMLTMLLGVAIFERILGLPLGLQVFSVDFLGLFLTVIMGASGMIFIGFLLSAINLVSARLQFTLGEYVSGIFFLLGGVAFPPSSLPGFAQAISGVLPVTYFLNSVRAHLFPGQWGSSLGSLVPLFLVTVATAVVSMIIFSLAERYAKSKGILDRVAEY